MKTIALLSSILLITLTSSTFANHHGHEGHQMPGAANAPFSASMDKMHKSMNIKPSGNINIDFLKGMIPHHQGAVDMSNELLKTSKDKQVKEFAQKIIDTQKAEIKMMEEMIKRINSEKK